MKITIHPATVRDLSFILAHLQPSDAAEVDCQLDGHDRVILAYGAMADPAFAHIAKVDGQPVAGFGVTRQRSTLAHGWSWGTPKMRWAVPDMIRFSREYISPDMVEAGILRCEARALASNTMAHKILLAMGAVRRCHLPAYGGDGENFILYEWLASDFQRGTAHVHRRDLRQTETSEARRRRPRADTR